jgi:hypothetical protein
MDEGRLNASKPIAVWVCSQGSGSEEMYVSLQRKVSGGIVFWDEERKVQAGMTEEGDI